jgi:hypothetical protein
LVADAAAAGQYDAVHQLATWARVIADLVREPSSPTPSAAVRIAASAAPGNPIGRQREKSAYPKFCRRQNDLVKIGWSKREKKEYQHKAPHAALRALAATIGRVGAGGKVFSLERCLPLTEGATNESIPEYQVYVCLALLKHARLVDQHGRRGYSLRYTRGFMEAVDASWRQLPEG